jgi:hypothetical protein
MSGQLHALAILFLGKEPSYPSEGKLSEPQGNKCPWHLPEIEPRLIYCSSRNLVTVVTELSPLERSLLLADFILAFLSAGLWHTVVWPIFTTVSEQYAASSSGYITGAVTKISSFQCIQLYRCLLPTFPHEDGSTSRFRKVVFWSEYWMMDKVPKPSCFCWTKELHVAWGFWREQMCFVANMYGVWGSHRSDYVEYDILECDAV